MSFGGFKSSFSKFVDDTKSEISGNKKKDDSKLVSSGPPPKPPQTINKQQPTTTYQQQPQYQQQQQPQYQQQQQPQYQQQQQQQQQQHYQQQPTNLNKSYEAPTTTTTTTTSNYQTQPAVSLTKSHETGPTISLEKQPLQPSQPTRKFAPPVPTTNQPVVPPQRPAPPPKPLSSQPSQYQQPPQYQQQQQPQQQQKDGASIISLEKKSDKDENKSGIPVDVKKHTDLAKTNANIALHAIGAPIDGGIIKANIPPLYLIDPMYLANIQYTNIILEIKEATLKPIELGQKKDPIYKKVNLIIYRTIIEDVIIIQIGEIFIYTNLREKPSFRAYGYHYIIADNYNNYFMIKVDKGSTTEEQLNQLEVILTYYTTYYRVPLKQEFEDKTAKKLDGASDKVESTSQSISRGLVSGGTYFAKGASKVGEVYKNNTKKYDGPELTEEQKRQLEDPNSDINKTGKTTDKMAQGTSSVVQGISKGFGFVGSKAAQGVHSTSWYKEREAKKKEDERVNGKNEKKEAGSQMAGSGIGAITTVFGGLQEGILISSRGVRDASVDATRHTSGDFAAEKSKRKWDSAGNLTVSVVNIVSILGATWIKAAIYTAAGAITYDPDMVNALGGSYWKAGWLTMRTDLLAGSNWKPRWVVLRNATIAIYTSPTDPASKPLESFYLSSVRGVTKISKERSGGRPYCFDIVTQGGSFAFSAHIPEIDFSDESFTPNPEDEVFQWSNSILSVSAFVGDLKEK
ncbi:hypothetical protein ACTFIZ_001814 [Dictyostelium cf. discoideum]